MSMPAIHSDSLKYYIDHPSSNACFIKGDNNEMQSLKINRIATNIFAKLWASFLHLIGTHVKVSSDSSDYSIKIGAVAQLCGISKQEAKQVIRENRTELCTIEREKSLKQEKAEFRSELETIQTYIEKAEKLERSITPLVGKIIGLRTEEDFENYLTITFEQYIEENRPMVSEIYLLNKTMEEIRKRMDKVLEDVKDLPNLKRIQELEEFAKNGRAVLSIIAHIGFHLEEMEALERANSHFKEFSCFATTRCKLPAKFRCKALLPGHPWALKNLKIDDYVEKREIRAILDNWNRFAKRSTTKELLTMPASSRKIVTKLTVEIAG